MYSKFKVAARYGAQVFNKGKVAVATGTGLMLTAAAHAQEGASLPTGYSDISSGAESTFTWAKGFAIGVVVFTMVLSLIKLARKR